MIEELNAALLSWTRRDTHAMAAVTRICAALGEGRTPRARCALVANEEVLAGTTDPSEATALVRIVAEAGGRRLLLGTLDGLDGLDADWMAVEPMETRDGTYVGALVALGPLASRDDALPSLPTVSLVCGDIASELLSEKRRARALHRFNNALAAVAANVDQIALLAGTDLAPAQRAQIVTCSALASEGLDGLFAAAKDLR